MPPAPSITVRIVRRLPVVVDGGANRWIVAYVRCGKYGSHTHFFAKNEATGELLTIWHGRTKEMEAAAGVGFTVIREANPVVYRILARMVSLKWAEHVEGTGQQVPFV